MRSRDAEALIKLAEWCREYSVELMAMDGKVCFIFNHKPGLDHFYSQHFTQYAQSVSCWDTVQIAAQAECDKRNKGEG